MKKYYLSIDGQQSGPYSLDELKVMGLTDQNLIWEEGMTSWVTVNQLTELKESVKLTPPPLPINKFQELAIFRRTIKQAFILFCVLFIIVFPALGGLNDKYDIEKSYKPETGVIANVEMPTNDSRVNYLYINTDGDEIRYDILLPLSLVIAIFITMVIVCIRYRLAIRKEIKRLSL